MIESEIIISGDFKKVKYDGYLYKVSKISKIPSDYDTFKSFRHKCSDAKVYNYVLTNWLRVNNKVYFINFCNKCKTLFIKECDE